jgi:hypothetical protein
MPTCAGQAITSETREIAELNKADGKRNEYELKEHHDDEYDIGATA